MIKDTVLYRSAVLQGIHINIQVVSKGIQKAATYLTLEDEFLMVLMKLHLALNNQDLAYRFRVSLGMVIKIYHKWMHGMSTRLKPLVVWPQRNAGEMSLPEASKPKVKNMRCFITCLEINQSINQSNFYSANIPDVARFTPLL